MVITDTVRARYTYRYKKVSILKKLVGGCSFDCKVDQVTKIRLISVGTSYNCNTSYCSYVAIVDITKMNKRNGVSCKNQIVKNMAPLVHISKFRVVSVNKTAHPSVEILDDDV